MAISVTPLGESFGAEIGNVDLTAPLDEATFAEIRQVLIEKQVAVISRVPTDVKVLVDFGHRFGTFRPHILSQYHHPEAHEVAVISNDPGTGFARTTSRPAGSFWHADLTYEKRPCDGLRRSTATEGASQVRRSSVYQRSRKQRIPM
jgi:taurine dioxygenase